MTELRVVPLVVLEETRAFSSDLALVSKWSSPARRGAGRRPRSPPLLLARGGLDALDRVRDHLAAHASAPVARSGARAGGEVTSLDDHTARPPRRMAPRVVRVARRHLRRLLPPSLPPRAGDRVASIPPPPRPPPAGRRRRPRAATPAPPRRPRPRALTPRPRTRARPGRRSTGLPNFKLVGFRSPSPAARTFAESCFSVRRTARAIALSSAKNTWLPSRCDSSSRLRGRGHRRAAPSPSDGTCGPASRLP